MPWILVAEPEGRFAERARDGLAADGWQIETVASAEAARAATAKRVPDLVIANAELPGAAELLARFARRSGGNGAIALLPELGGGQEAARAADESLAKPFTDQDLRLLVRRLATTGRAHRAPAPAGEGEHRLTSKDLFGDVLAEMEAESAAPTPQRPPAAAALPPAPPPGAATSGGGARRPPAGAPSVDRALEETLSGLLKEGRAKPAAPRKSDAGVDALLSRTLSGLDVGERAKRPAPAPAAAPPPIALSPSEPRPRAASPSEASRPGRAEPPPPLERTPPAAPSVDRLLASVQPPPVPETKRGSRELDLSQLDVLAHPKPKDKPVEAFSTQRVALPTALRGKAAATEFGQYTLLERIAVGGMAEVWKARMKGVEGFQKTVAIKKILSHLTDSSDFVTMFIDEAKLAAQLNHNNIIHIYDLGKLGDDYYIAMEFVDGRDLRTILNTAREKNQPLPLGLALLVTSRLASALDYAHRKKDFEGRELGLVHRDVSPQNVLISFEGDIKLCDFGIVKAVSKASKTQMGALKGKLQYMSPEQAWGRPVDARSDIFSLGSLLFELLTGRRLFAGESEMSVLDAVREGRIQAPRDLDPRLPLEVNALVLKALAKEPGDRFESAGAMQRDLDAILASLKPSPTPQELANYVKRLFGAEARVEEPIRAAPTPAVEPVAPAPPPAKAVPSEPPRAAPATLAAAPARPASGRDAALEPAMPGRNLLWLAAAAVVVLSLVGYFVFGRRGAEPEAPADAAATEAAPGAAVPAPGETQPVAPAEPAAAPAADVGKIVDEEMRRREAELKKQYEESLRKKQTEVAAATPPPAAATPPATQPPVETAPEPAAPAATEPAPEPTAEPDASAAATTEPAPATSVAEPQPEPAPVTPAPAPTPPKPSVQEGDLVRPGAGVKPPVLVSFSKPEYPPIARRMKVEGTVVLSLLVDERGGVLEVKLERGIQQNVGINEAAQAAGRSAKFQPAMKDGVRVKMWYQLTIPFKL